MLVLSRKLNQCIMVGDVKIMVVKLGGNRVSLGVDAPRDVPIVRGELEPRERQPGEPTEADSDAAEA